MSSRISKYISIAFALVILVWVICSLDLKTYRDYVDQDISLNRENSFLNEAQVITSPTQEDFIIKKIDAAQKRVWVGVYTFTVPSLREALLRAKQRGVDVRVILEKSPFQSGSLNSETRKFLQGNSIPLHESGAGQFAFMHAKYMIIDDDWIIETANWTRASFAKNREFFVLGNDIEILRSLENIFEKDFAGNSGSASSSKIVAGPTNAHERLIDFIQTANSSIEMYAPDLSDEKIISALSSECAHGKKVQIILAYYADAEPRNYDDCFQVQYLKKITLHAKAIILDENRSFVGSFNYTKNSLSSNREIGVFLGENPTKTLVESFQRDWQLSGIGKTTK